MSNEMDGLLCRLCLQNNQTISQDIFKDEGHMYHKIVACLPINISRNDDLPKQICNDCLLKIDEFYMFRKMAMNSENTLLNGKSYNSCDGDVDSLYVSTCNCKLIKNELMSISTQTDPIFECCNANEVKKEYTENGCVSIFAASKLEVKIKCEEIDDLMIDDCGDALMESDLSTAVDSGKYSMTDNDSDVILLPRGKSKSKDKSEMCSSSESLAKLMKATKRKDSELKKEPLKKKKNDLWICCVCIKKCYKKSEIIKHYKSHNALPPFVERDSDLIVSNAIVDKKRLTCKMCDKLFLSKRVFIDHLNEHNFNILYKCTLCEKTFQDMTNLLYHGKDTIKSCTRNQEEEISNSLPSKKFMCDVCSEEFSVMKSLLRHRKTIHPEIVHDFVHRCLHCHREFAHLNSLRRHLRSHTGNKEFLCYMCGKAMSSWEHLKFHMRIHTGFKPNVCKTCGKGFVKKCNLILHERIHSGEKPHVCSYCGKAFSQKSTLVIHERYHSGSKPYVCDFCNKGFVAKGLLSVHVKTSCTKKV